MNEKRTPTESVPEGERPPAAGAKPRKRLERSRDDRYIGGVAAGIGTYLGIDPILIRLAFVASILVGGIGILVYLVLLAAVPIEGDPDVPPEPVEGRRRNLVIAGTVAVGILALFAVGRSGFTAWVFGFGPGVVFGIFAWLAAAGLLTLLLMAARDEPAPGVEASPSPGGPAPASGSASGKESPSPSQPEKGRAPATAEKSGGPPPVIAPSPSQTAPTGVLPGGADEPTAVMPDGPVDDGPSTIGKIMTWFAIGISALILLSVIVVVAAGVTAVAGAVPMAALVILLGAGMVVAGIKGKQVVAAWLLAAALAVALPMAVVSIAGLGIEGSYGEVREAPVSAGDLPDDGYKLAAGEMEIDLRKYPFRSGETVEIPVTSGFGVTSIVVPDRVCVAGEFSGKAGLIDIRGTESSGVEIDRSIGRPKNDSPTLVLDAEFKLGALEIADGTEWRRHGGDPGNFGTFNYNDAENRVVRERARAACEGGAAGGGKKAENGKAGGKADGKAGNQSAGQGQGSGNGGSSG